MTTHKFNFVMVSGNAKTGPIPVTMTSKDSCPDACPLKANGCYASAGRINIHWSRMNRIGLGFDELLASIKSIPEGRVWRHNQAGDLPGSNDKIDAKSLRAITAANQGRKGFTYSHYDPTIKGNGKAIANANSNGFTVNLSADNLKEADDLSALNIGPVVTILPSDHKGNATTPSGRKVIVCPNYTHGTQCIDCKLCQRADRTVIVGFPAHGASFKKVNAVINQ